MNASLSELLTCPRCGPEWGLVLMPTVARGRWVEAGVLGCPNCRERYRVDGGVAELAIPGEGGVVSGAPTEAWGEGREPAVRLAALLGLAEGGGAVVLAGDAARHALALASLAPDVDVIAVVPAGDAGPAPAPGGSAGAEGEEDPGAGWSVLRVSSVLPVRSGGVRAVALTGWASGWLEEGARVVGMGGRLLAEPAPGNAAARLEGSGLRILAREGSTVVATR